MIDDRRSDAGLDRRDLAERHRRRRAVRARITSGSWRRSAARCARLRRETHVTSRISPRRILPVARVDAGERRTQRLRDLTDRHAERAGNAAVELHLELRLLALRGQTDVHRARHLLDARRDLLGACASAAMSLPRDLELDLLASAAEVAS